MSYDRITRGYALLQQLASGPSNGFEQINLQGVDEVYDSDGNSALHLAAKFFNLNAFTALLDALRIRMLIQRHPLMFYWLKSMIINSTSRGSWL